jgi:hypothetical protein
MPKRPSVRIPKIRHNKARNEARVRIKGRDVYLGKFGTPEAEAVYRRVIAEYVATGEAPQAKRDLASMTVGELCDLYDAHTRKVMEPRSHAGCVKPALERLRAFAGDMVLSGFGPGELKAWRMALVSEGTTGKARSVASAAATSTASSSTV